MDIEYTSQSIRRIAQELNDMDVAYLNYEGLLEEKIKNLATALLLHANFISQSSTIDTMTEYGELDYPVVINNVNSTII
jgi:hypothetical protein